MIRKLLLILAASVSVTLGCQQTSPLPALYPVPNARLINEQGRDISLASLRGNVAVYDFIFTSCAGICPIMGQRMKAVAGKFPPHEPIRFVSISIDPTRDTPGKMKRYGAAMRGDEQRWLFLTGRRDEILRLSVQGFKLAAGSGNDAKADPLLHSAKFVLADAGGTIRGYYDGTAEESVDRLVADARSLMRDAR